MGSIAKREAMMKPIQFTVPLAPPSMNILLRRHWSYRRNQKALWMGMMHAELGRKNLATLRAWRELGCRVRVTIDVAHKRKFDPDNLVSCAKIPLDAMKALRMLVDDSSDWLDLIVVECVGKKVATEITIHNLQATGGNGAPRSLARFTNKRRAQT